MADASHALCHSEVKMAYRGSLNSTKAKAGGLGGVLRSMPTILPYCNRGHTRSQNRLGFGSLHISVPQIYAGRAYLVRGLGMVKFSEACKTFLPILRATWRHQNSPEVIARDLCCSKVLEASQFNLVCDGQIAVNYLVKYVFHLTLSHISRQIAYKDRASISARHLSSVSYEGY